MEKQLSELKASRQMLGRRYSFLFEELKLARELAREGAVSKVEVLRLERQVSDSQGEMKVYEKKLEQVEAQQQEAFQRLKEVQLSFVNKSRLELNETIGVLHELSAKEALVSDQVDRTLVRAPMRGVVNQIFVNTEGGVVQPGMTIIELTPIDDSLEVEVKIHPRDIAFLHPGQQATVRFTAYDFTIYGGIEGTLTSISADTIEDEKGDSFYLARVVTKANNLGNENDNARPIIPGMVAMVDILTGKKTLLDYLLKPVLRAKQLAFSER